VLEKKIQKETADIQKTENEALEYAESIIDTIREPLIALDQDLRVVKVSRSFYEVFKVKPEETVGQLIYDLGNKQWDIPKLRELLETILPLKTSFDNYEVEHDFTTIGRRVMLLNARQIQRMLGKERIILLAIEDITERREIESGLEKTKRELEVTKISEDEALEYSENVINTVREPLIALDQYLRVVSASRSFYEFFKVKPEETVGKLIYDLGNKQWDIPKLRELLETILPQKATFDNYEVEHDFTTIGRRVMLLNARQIHRVLGKERIILLAIEDITERREIEKGLEKTRQELQLTQKSEDEALEYAENVINTVREPLIALDQYLRVVSVSRSFYEFFKVKPEETVGKLIYDLGNKQWDIPKLRELLETILPQKATFDNYEVEHDFATIGRRVMLLNARQIHRVLGKERIILLAIDDITERKKTEDTLQRLEEEYHSFMEKALSEQMALNDILRNTTVSRDDLMKEVAARKKTEYMLMVQMRQVQALYNLAEIIEREGISLNEFYQELADILPKSWQYPEITGARIIIGESEFRTNNFVETEWRQSATIKANGLKAGRIDINYLEQKPKQDKGPFLSAERMLLDAIAERVGRVIEHKQLEETFKDSELRYRRFFETARDGILILDEETGTVVNVNPIMVEMMGFSREEFLGKKIWELGFLKDIIANRDNFEELKRKKYITYENLPLETAAGQMKEVEFVSNVYEVGNHKVIQCNVRDITIRRRMEIEREKYTKELVEKNTELERFTYTVSHDLKSPLVTIKTFLGYLAQDISAADKERIEKDVLFMNGAADKMGNLLRELLEMSRVGRMVNLPVEVTFRELVRETMTLVAGAVAEKGIQVKVSNDLVTLFGDRPRLIEIWQNLVENAVKFMPDQTSPQIDIGIEHPGNETIFFVRDNGLGIEPRYQSKLFNLFEKINAKTEGTGMGLAITKRIVELYRGRIWVESKGLGQGTVFFFTLPGALKDNGKGV
jgi:PAS domain S-box-containing protein